MREYERIELSSRGESIGKQTRIRRSRGQAFDASFPMHIYIHSECIITSIDFHNPMQVTLEPFVTPIFR